MDVRRIGEHSGLDCHAFYMSFLGGCYSVSVCNPGGLERCRWAIRDSPTPRCLGRQCHCPPLLAPPTGTQMQDVRVSSGLIFCIGDRKTRGKRAQFQLPKALTPVCSEGCRPVGMGNGSDFDLRLTFPQSKCVSCGRTVPLVASADWRVS